MTSVLYHELKKDGGENILNKWLCVQMVSIDDERGSINAFKHHM